ncbi:hypothetical protein I4F81_009643 [Pyropia yezoensis]|uniref:Uncharacterized protein n=1 Tax=Pyropia yezoensis TaxID=2788 RepID=A0ACC3CAE6_PYRYE|nr:hypothetical protein I4F81_009643 [Neopyropia yezoensis]
MAPGDPPPDGGRPRPSLFIPQMTTSDLSHAIRRVDTSLEVGPAAEANAITRVNTLPLTRSGDGGKERGKDAADSDGASWGDLHDAIRRVDTAPRVGATGGQSGANPAAAAAPPASSADPDGTSGGVDSSTDGIDDAATDGGGPAPGAPVVFGVDVVAVGLGERGGRRGVHGDLRRGRRSASGWPVGH